MVTLGCCVFQRGVDFSPQAEPKLWVLKVEQQAAFTLSTVKKKMYLDSILKSAWNEKSTDENVSIL